MLPDLVILTNSLPFYRVAMLTDLVIPTSRLPSDSMAVPTDLVTQACCVEAAQCPWGINFNSFLPCDHL